MPRYLISLDVEEDGDDAQEVLEAIARAVGAGMTIGSGISGMGTEWSVTAVDDSDYPHGDYRDAEGNLLHVHEDMVVSVTYANGDVDSESVQVPVQLWEQEHGTVISAREAEASRHRDAEGNRLWVLDGSVVKALIVESGQILDHIEVPVQVWAQHHGNVEEDPES